VEKISDATLALDAWVQRCDFGFRRSNLFVKQKRNHEPVFPTGVIPTRRRGPGLKEGESPESGIKRVFAEHTPDKNLVARCVLAPNRDDKPPKGVQRFTFVPDKAFQKELDAKGRSE